MPYEEEENAAARVTVQARELFAVPLVVCEWPDSHVLNTRLKAAILELMRVSPGTVKTNRRGWQSNSDLHLSQDPAIRAFVARIYSAVEAMVGLIDRGDRRHLDGWKIQGCWANVNPPGGFNRPHHHDGPHSQFSGFYYVDVGDDGGDPGKRGATRFEDRSGVARYSASGDDLRSREYEIVPRPGVMALFPAVQYHYVKPYRGSGSRISIAFNVYHPDFRVLYYEGMQQPSWWWRNFRGLAILPRKIPEKIEGVLLLCALMVREPLPGGRGLAAWREHLRVQVSRAFAEASARRELKRAGAAARAELER